MPARVVTLAPVPGDYPPHWEADVVLADGGTVHVRPIRPDDADRLAALHERLSPETVYFRFFAPYPRLSPRDLVRLTTVDYDRRCALVALLGGEIVAVVRYEPLSADEAEVAFVVDDAHQGRGIGSILLEHLAAVARERGFRRFVAEVLPANRRMVRVFVDAGYQAKQSLEEGVVRLEFGIEPTATSLAVMQAREHRAEARSIERLLHPRSVAVVGASRQRGTLGRVLFDRLLGSGFEGPVYPVNPSAPYVASVRAYPSLLEVPDEIDLAVVVVPAAAVCGVVAEAAQRGVHALLVVAAGFGEAGSEGRERESELVSVARANGMRVVGPNSFGIVNTDPRVRLNASIAPAPRPAGWGCSRSPGRSASRSWSPRRGAVWGCPRSSRRATAPTCPGTTCCSSGRTIRRPTSCCCTWSRSGTRGSSAASPGGSRRANRSSR